MLHVLTRAITVCAVLATEVICSRATTSSSKEIFETTYSLPIVKDPTIFNLPQDLSIEARDILPTQLQGRIYFPLSAPRNRSTSLVFLLSGKHPDCRELVEVPGFGPYPIDGGAMISPGVCPPGQRVIKGYRGFDYLGRVLAARGFAALSVDPLLLNNAQAPEDDPFLSAARARLILKTIEKMRYWEANPQESQGVLGFNISDTLNFSSIGLMGHSRGGAGVRLAYNMLMTPDQLPVQETTDWASNLNASIKAVLEVAPLDVVEEHTQTDVLGAPWGLVGAGCESDEVDYAYYRLVQRQSRLNTCQNHFLNVYGASHEYFNTEWHQAIDACLGDQENTWNTSARTFEYTGKGQNVSIPLVLGSQKQQDALKWALSNFFEAYLGKSQNQALEKTLTASANRSEVILDANAKIGLANPNIALSEVLQDFEKLSLENISSIPDGLHFQTIVAHATSQFPRFQSQISRFGLPPFYRYLLGNSYLPSNFTLAVAAVYDDGIVFPLSNLRQSTTIQIPLKRTATMNCSSTLASIQFDIARRSTCFLPTLGASNSTLSNDIRAAKHCSVPREFEVHARVSSFAQQSNQQEKRAITYNSSALLKSRFNFEWAPYNLSAAQPGTSNLTVSLLPIAWETMVLDEIPRAKRNISTSEEESGIQEMLLELDLSASAEELQIYETTRNAGIDDFVYVGIVRRVCL